MPVSLQVKNIDKLAASLAAGDSARPTIRMAIAIVGPAAKYALVWEWGSARLTKPGPKTTWGINPDGEVVILTLTAPFGYIRVHKQEYRDIIREELGKTSWSRVKVRNLRERASEALERAATRIAALIADSAPYDTGELASSIEVVTVDSPNAPRLKDRLTVRPVVQP